ncbi:MAG: helix-turn-helix transcriptional regulator [Saccharopolyspora sp.]|uniref:helix-turn-helix domain-containing protein n=1 Tax=Saccharopolyspora TaxID=1835 RepID=UPI00190C6239|nr:MULTISPECIES: helix-turn-helix transcriptional regulator [unclassified Saccharopolyspora]MBK0869561.1 helix-turn-helix transcriptional regulator [Saccharopolyspora sp. HNM0986]MBQ6640842.1 helix-turn-helix transcriptional regulator [Saccharopolyspora sp.]
MSKFAGSQARAIGAEIRRSRDSLGWTLDRLANATDISRSTLSRIETGVRRPEVDEVASVLTALSVTGPAKDRLIRLAGDVSGTWVGVGDAVAQQLSAISAYEAEAQSIYEFQVSVMPGLLQTPDYTRGLISTTPLGSAERERAVFNRVGRQSVLARPGLRYSAFFDEAALRRRVKSHAGTMVEQLRALITVGGEEGRSVRVVPFSAGAYWGCESSFVFYGLGGCHVVYLENQGSGVFIDGQSEDTYWKVLENLDNVALDAAESKALVTGYLEEYENELRVS